MYLGGEHAGSTTAGVYATAHARAPLTSTCRGDGELVVHGEKVKTGEYVSLRLTFGADGLGTLEYGVNGGDMVAVFAGLAGPLCASVDVYTEVGLCVRVGRGLAPP